MASTRGTPKPSCSEVQASTSDSWYHWRRFLSDTLPANTTRLCTPSRWARLFKECRYWGGEACPTSTSLASGRNRDSTAKAAMRSCWHLLGASRPTNSTVPPPSRSVLSPCPDGGTPLPSFHSTGATTTSSMPKSLSSWALNSESAIPRRVSRASCPSCWRPRWTLLASSGCHDWK